MKKSVLFIGLLLVMTNFALAHVCDGGDINLHGFYVEGECFTCNESDGICVEDVLGLGSCAPYVDPDCPVVIIPPESFWSTDNVTDIVSSFDVPYEVSGFSGGVIYMVVENTGLSDGTTVNFNIYKYGFIFDEEISVGEIQGTVQGDKVVGIFEINDESDLAVAGYEDIYEFFFTASGGSLSETSGYIYINATDTGGPMITDPSDYTDEESCESDLEEVCVYEGTFEGYGLTPELCQRRRDSINCTWNNDTSVCEQVFNYTYAETNDASCDQTITSCTYRQDSKTDCTEGEDAFIVSYISDNTGCDPWSSGPIPCPQQLKVPFFGIYEFIASLCFISLIYVYLIFKNK